MNLTRNKISKLKKKRTSLEKNLKIIKNINTIRLVKIKVKDTLKIIL